MSEFTKTLLQFTHDNADRCSRNWLETVIEWTHLELIRSRGTPTASSEGEGQSEDS